MVEFKIKVKVRWWVRPFIKVLAYLCAAGFLREQHAYALARDVCVHGVLLSGKRIGNGSR